MRVILNQEVYNLIISVLNLYNCLFGKSNRTDNKIFYQNNLHVSVRALCEFGKVSVIHNHGEVSYALFTKVSAEQGAKAHQADKLYK